MGAGRRGDMGVRDVRVVPGCNRTMLEQSGDAAEKCERHDGRRESGDASAEQALGEGIESYIQGGSPGQRANDAYFAHAGPRASLSRPES